MTIDENASVYVLYAGKDPKVKKVVEEIKIMLEEKGIEGFDYQARDVADKPDREKKHDTMDGLYQAIGNGRVIIMHLDKHYLQSKFCLNEISIIVQKSPTKEDIKERIVPIVHNRDIIDKLYDKKEHKKLRKIVEDTITKYIKENKKILKSDDITKLNNYPIDAEKFFKILAEIRYQSIEYEDNEDTRKNIDNKLSAKTIDLQKYLKEEREKIEESVRANKATNWYLPKIFAIMLIMIAALFVIFYSLKNGQEKIQSRMDNFSIFKEIPSQEFLVKLNKKEFNKETRIKLNEAQVYIDAGEYANAIKVYDDILKKDENLNEKNRKDLYRKRVEIYLKMRNWKNAKNAATKYIGFLKALEQNNDNTDTAYAYMQYGQVYYWQGNYVQARKQFNVAKSIYTSQKDIAWALSWIGDTYKKQKKYLDANKTFNTSLKLYMGTKDSKHINIPWLNSQIGYTNDKLGYSSAAIKFWKTAIDKYEDINDEGKYNGKLGWCYNNLGWIYEKADIPEYNVTLALQYYKKSCDFGEKWGCNNTATLYRSGKGVDKNKTQAVLYYDKSCDLNHSEACSWAGYIYEDKDNERFVINRYKKACKLEDYWSCNRLGILYRDENDLGIEKDLKRAMYYFSLGCDGNYSTSCTSAGLMFERGNGVDKNDTRASEYYKKACEFKDAWGCYDMGLNLEYGRGVEKNKKQARRYYKEACDIGHEGDACDRLSFSEWQCDTNGSVEITKRQAGVHKKLCNDKNISSSCKVLGEFYRNSDKNLSKLYYQKEFDILKKECRNGNDQSCVEQSVKYWHEHNLAIDENISKFLQINEKLCTEKKQKGCYLLANYYDDFIRIHTLGEKKLTQRSNMEAIERKEKYLEETYKICKGNICQIVGLDYESNRDFSKALKSFEKACNTKDIGSCKYAARYYRDGNGTKIDIDKAIEYYEIVAKEGDAEAQEELANIYYDKGSFYDKEEALKFYKKAANQDMYWSAYQVGWMLKNGEGAPRDINASIKWFHQGYDNGSMNAAEELAGYYCEGKYVEKDFNKAFYLFNEAAEAGLEWSMYRLGCMYESVKGTERDYSEAIKWYEKAYNLGNVDAGLRLIELRTLLDKN